MCAQIGVSSDPEEEILPVAKRPRVKLELPDSDSESKPLPSSSIPPPSSYPPTIDSHSDGDIPPWPTTLPKPEPASQLPKPEPISQPFLVPPPPPSSYPPTLDNDSDDDIPPWPTTLPKPEPLSQPFPISPTLRKSEPLTQTNIHQFFSQYTSRAFEYNPSQPVMSEFYRMVDSNAFPKASQAQAKREIEDALTMDFNLIYGTDVGDLEAWQGLCRVLGFGDMPDDLIYGTDVGDLEAWQGLCRVLGFGDMPDDLAECKRVVAATYVNIVDLIDTKLTGQPVRHFDSERALAKYTRNHRKFFPRNNVLSGGLLKFLLRRIHRPTAATRDNPNPRYAPR
ncbi:hypothetical protein RSAG8_10163, partial [Rhizoctonia solani AG-8 WAC10335]